MSSPQDGLHDARIAVVRGEDSSVQKSDLTLTATASVCTTAQGTRALLHVIYLLRCHCDYTQGPLARATASREVSRVIDSTYDVQKDNSIREQLGGSPIGSHVCPWAPSNALATSDITNTAWSGTAVLVSRRPPPERCCGGGPPSPCPVAPGLARRREPASVLIIRPAQMKDERRVCQVMDRAPHVTGTDGRDVTET